MKREVNLVPLPTTHFSKWLTGNISRFLSKKEKSAKNVKKCQKINVENRVLRRLVINIGHRGYFMKLHYLSKEDHWDDVNVFLNRILSHWYFSTNMWEKLSLTERNGTERVQLIFKAHSLVVTENVTAHGSPKSLSYKGITKKIFDFSIFFSSQKYVFLTFLFFDVGYHFA